MPRSAGGDPTPPRSRLVPLLVAAGVFLLAAQGTRIALLALHPPAEGLAGALRALASGSVFDLMATLWLLAPYALWLAAVPERRWSGRITRATIHAGTWTAVALALFVAVAELLFFDEFDGRFNFVAVDYLVYPTEVAGNLRQSYPMGWLLGAIALAATLAYLALRPLLARARPAVSGARRRLALAAGPLAAACALAALVPPTLSRVSDDRALDEIASSGYYTFWQALRGLDAPYEGLYATRPDSQLFGRLDTLLREPGEGALRLAGSTARDVRADRPPRRLNVVVVLEESLGSELVGTLHPRARTLTPRFDSLAAEGVLLTHAYSTGNRTIRALEATTSSLPPLPGVSVVRRAASRDLFTLPSLLRDRGWATEFVYGGRALFDGMGSYMLRNGMERVVDQADMPDGAFTTAWGVADEFIFDRALAEMDSLHATGRPFYTLVLTVSNHRPYAFPAGRIEQPLAGLHRENAVAYADWALGRFVRQARAHAWFDSTLFVLMGDHGARVYGAAEIPLASYEVPILLYAPRLLAPRAVPTLASSLDVPPTVLALLGVSYRSKFFGHDVLRARPEDGRALMTHNSELALMRGGRMAVLGLHRATSLYRVDVDSATMTLMDATDAEGARLIEDAIAYYDGADRVYRTGAYRHEPARVAAAPADSARRRAPPARPRGD